MVDVNTALRCQVSVMKPSTSTAAAATAMCRRRAEPMAAVARPAAVSIVTAGKAGYCRWSETSA